MVDGNGFVAAFVGGLAFGELRGRGEAREVFYVEQTSGSRAFIALLTWLSSGRGRPDVGDAGTGEMLGYAVLPASP